NAGSYALALDLAEAGFGVTIAPAPLVAARHRLAWRALPGQPLMRRVGICYAVQAQANPAVERVLAHFSHGAPLRTS
ncbi:LysR substrate-binding domain-containing protein, partial [Pantoea dispersa]